MTLRNYTLEEENARKAGKEKGKNRGKFFLKFILLKNKILYNVYITGKRPAKKMRSCSTDCKFSSDKHEDNEPDPFP